MNDDTYKIRRLELKANRDSERNALIKSLLTNPLLESVVWSLFVAYMTRKNQERIASQPGFDFSFFEGAAEWTIGEAVIACQQLAGSDLLKNWAASGSAGLLPGIVRKII